jgi:hypothetical protein
MKLEIIKKLTLDFELVVQHTGETEYWFARDLQVLLDYEQ